ncbi:MAG TPA: D-xylose transporter XylE [Microscillaceae bacterium]|nr:D-xylose transporter XylE [Microscillaceae bacterium]
MKSSNPTKLLFITLVATLGGLLFGYDTAVISGAIGNLKQHFALSDAAMGWAASSALVGCIAGAVLAAFLSSSLGRKKSLLLAAVLFLISAIGTAFPANFTQFILFRIIGGIGVGLASMLSPMYIAEIAPAHKRGQLVSYNQFAIIFGMLLVYFVNYFIALQGNTTWNIATGWRWMFLSEAIPAGLFLLMLLLVPASPRWLMMKGRREEAKQVLLQMNSVDVTQQTLASIEASFQQKQGTWQDLLKPGIRKLLVIGVFLSVFQQVTGINVFLYYAPEIFKSFGSGSNTALLQTILVGAVNLIFTIIAIFTVDKIGRKPLQMIGALGMAFCIGMIGFGAYAQNVGGWLLIFVLGYIASFALSWGPVTWVLLSEIFPNKIRSLALSVAVAAQWISNFAVSQTFPMIDGNPFLKNTFHGAFPFWLYGVMGVLATIFVYRFVPETKGKSLEELEETLVHNHNKAIKHNQLEKIS